MVECLVTLTHTDAATRLFRLAARGAVEFWAPDLIFAECVSALRKLVRLGALDDEPGGRAVGHLVQLPISVTGTAGLMSSVWNTRLFLTPYDACYVALSDELGAAFVTGERDLAAELRRRGMRAHYLGDL